MMLVFTNYKQIDGLGCIFLMYISYCKKIKSWAIDYTYCKHNQTINPDKFYYNIDQSWCISYDKTIELAKGFQGEVSYRKVKAILQNHDLKIEYKEFYNLMQKFYAKRNDKRVERSKKTLFFTCMFRQKVLLSSLSQNLYL